MGGDYIFSWPNVMGLALGMIGVVVYVQSKMENDEPVKKDQFNLISKFDVDDDDDDESEDDDERKNKKVSNC